MWLFPVLSILTAVAIVAILVQMVCQADVRSQLVLSLLSWAVVIVLSSRNKWFVQRRPAVEGALPPAGLTACWCWPIRPSSPRNCSTSCVASARTGTPSTSWWCRPVPIETGAAATHGPLDVAEATREVAQQRLDDTLSTLRSENLDAEGEMGD